MSEKNNININERNEGENKVSGETLFMPKEYVEEGKAVEANVWDDIDTTDEAVDETKEETSLEFEPYENEQKYQSEGNIDQIASDKIRLFRKAMEKIGDSEDLSRDDYQAIGKLIYDDVLKEAD